MAKTTQESKTFESGVIR